MNATALTTHPAAAALRDLICAETRAVCQQTYGQTLRAIVLTGSLARNEATFVERPDGSTLLGDAEFLLVIHSGASLPSVSDAHRMRVEIERRLLRQGLRGAVTVSGVPPSYLHRLRPSIFAYELTACGSVIAGDQSVLNLVHRFPVSEIPLEDAWRLLANRVVEQLETLRELPADETTPLPDAVYYRTVKLVLDMATSLLVFVGGYKPTYTERSVSLRQLADSRSAEDWPFPARAFADAVRDCTEWKLSGQSAEGASRAFWGQAVHYAQALWAWELVRLLKLGNQPPAGGLMRQWMQRQPVGERVQSWASVLRRSGWLRSLGYWPRWMRLALRGSPRYLVYAAAGDLLFSVGTVAPATVRRIQRCLPVVSRIPDAAPSGVHLVAADIRENYYRFLVETSA
jgi:hypothetical protein